MTIQQMQDRFSRINATSLTSVEMRTVLRNEDKYIFHQTQQMFNGKAAGGGRIQTHEHNHYPYSPGYRRYKSKMHPDLLDRVSLFLFGSFYSKMHLEAKGADSFVIDSKARSKGGFNYPDWLTKHYGKYNGGIWGLSPEYKDPYLNGIMPFFVNEAINEFFQ